MRILSIAIVAASLSVYFSPLSTINKATESEYSSENVLLIGNGVIGSANYEKQSLALDDYEGNINFISENFNSLKNLSDPEYEDTFYNYLVEKKEYYGHYDGVIATSDSSLSFVMKYIDQEDSIFYEIPVLFNGVGNIHFAEECQEHPWVDGIPKHVDMEKILSVANDLSPYANSIYYIYDDNLTGNYYRDLLEEELEKNYKFEEDNIHPICTKEYTFEAMGEYVSTINREDITIFLNASINSEGEVHSSLEVGELLEDYFDTIVISASLNVVGTIATGGYFMDLEEVYINEFSMLDTYFSSNLTFDEIELNKDVSYNYIFDQEKLDEFDIYSMYLPSGSIIYNETLSFQEKYPEAFIVIVCLVVLFVITTIVLISLNLSQIDKTKKTRRLVDKLNRDVRINKKTQLPGKYAFNQDIDKMIKKGNKFVLAVINIDDYDKISYYFGEQRRKVFMVVIANYIRNLISKKINMYVYSEDEILLLFELKKYRELIDYVNSMRNNRKIKYKINDIDLNITWTTGYAVFPENGTTRKELTTNASYALQYAKSKNKGTGLIFSSRKVMPFKRISELNELFKYSVQNQLLENKYSPIVDLKTGEYEKLEITVNVKGLNIPFEECINIANSTSIIRDFEKISISKAADFINVTNKKCLDRCDRTRVMIKIPVLELNDVKLRVFLKRKFQQRNIDLKNVIFQLDESFVNVDDKTKEDFFNFVKKENVGLCLENFGDGYSSIKSLYDMNLEFVKFSSDITNLTFDKRGINTASSIIRYIHSLGIKVLITNIDSKEKALFFAKAGCDYGEGSYFDFELAEDDLLNNLLNHKKYLDKVNLFRIKGKDE